MALKFASIAAATTLALGAAPAFAAKPVAVAAPSMNNCANSYGVVIASTSMGASGSSAATGCSGYYAGNVMSGNAGDILTQQAAVSALGGSFDGNFGGLFGFGSLNGLNGGTILNFGTTFFGKAIVGAHFGNGGAVGNNTVFYSFDFGNAGASSLSFINAKALSNLYVYGSTTPPETAVPEPAAWALMILGFGAVGGALRRSKKTKFALTYA